MYSKNNKFNAVIRGNGSNHIKEVKQRGKRGIVHKDAYAAYGAEQTKYLSINHIITQYKRVQRLKTLNGSIVNDT